MLTRETRQKVIESFTKDNALFWLTNRKKDCTQFRGVMRFADVDNLYLVVNNNCYPIILCDRRYRHFYKYIRERVVLCMKEAQCEIEIAKRYMIGDIIKRFNNIPDELETEIWGYMTPPVIILKNPARVHGLHFSDRNRHN